MFLTAKGLLGDGVLVLPDADVRVANIAHDFVLQVLAGVGDLVQRQPGGVRMGKPQSMQIRPDDLFF